MKTVNVRLIKPQNDLRKKHPDRMFARESYKGVDELVTYFGPDSSVFLGHDDKSSVPLGVPCAKKQSSILMNMQIREPRRGSATQVRPMWLSGTASTTGAQHFPTMKTCRLF